MNTRDTFAAHAMQALLTGQDYVLQLIARDAYAMANAMMEEKARDRSRAERPGVIA